MNNEQNNLMSKILVVDDDTDILLALKYILRSEGFEVETLSEAKEVDKKVDEMNPDIMLLDVNLAGYDGRLICRHLKTEKGIDFPIILFSADPSYQPTAEKFGADDFIFKPFEVPHLISQLNSHIS